MLNALMIFIVMIEAWLAWRFDYWPKGLSGLFRFWRPLEIADGNPVSEESLIDGSRARARLAMIALGGLFIVLWIVSCLTSLHILQLVILSAAVGFGCLVRNKRLPLKSAMFGFGGLFVILSLLPYALRGSDDVKEPRPENPPMIAKGAPPVADCPQLAGERDDTAIRAPAHDPHDHRFDTSIDLLENSTALRRWMGWAGIGRVNDYNVLAMLHEQKGEYQDSFNLYKEASDEGDMYGEFNVGRLYLGGKSPEKKPEAALEYFQLAAAQNLAPAQYDLGVMYADGIGVKCDIAHAITLWFEAGRQGDAAAIAALGLRDHGHAKLMLDLAPIDIEFTDPDAVMKSERKLMAFAAEFDAKRTLPEDRRNAIIEAVRKECANRIDMIEKVVVDRHYSQYDGLQSWHECYSQAESQLF